VIGSEQKANSEYPAPILSRSASKAAPPTFDLIDQGTVELDEQGEPKTASKQQHGSAESQLLFLNDLESEMK